MPRTSCERPAILRSDLTMHVARLILGCVTLSRMRARVTTFLPALVSVFVWTSPSIDAQQKPQTRRPATTRATQPRTTKPSAEKPRAETGAPAAGLVREVPLMQCPSVLGNGIRTQRLFCDILTGTEPQEGLRVSIPAHEGTATLLFTLHNRQATIDEASEGRRRERRRHKGRGQQCRRGREDIRALHRDAARGDAERHAPAADRRPE